MKTAVTSRGEAETPDTFFRGRIRILQSKGGYRFAVDAPLLADFIRTRESDDALELGAGNGVISLLLSIKPFRHIIAVEIQPSLADLARRNIVLNGLEGKIQIALGDVREFDPGRTFDLIFSNPPYITKGGGYLSRTSEKSIAKHELHGDIGDFLRAAAGRLKPDGRACFIFPERRREDFIRAAESCGLLVRAVRSVHPRKGEPSNLFLSESRFSAGPAITLPPLVLFGPKGGYTKEAEEIFSGRTVLPIWDDVAGVPSRPV